MYDLIVSGGWLMIPILLCSLLMVAIVVERMWALTASRIIPDGLLLSVWQSYKAGEMTLEKIIELRSHSPLGEVLSAGLANRAHGRDVMKDAMEEAGSKVTHEMERFLSALGTIAAVTPLLGLLGTVVGMIQVFAEIMVSGTGNAGTLAGGISQALITTAAGLTIAIPAMIFHRHFERLIDGIVVDLEQQSARLVDAIYSGKSLVDKDPTEETVSAPTPQNRGRRKGDRA